MAIFTVGQSKKMCLEQHRKSLWKSRLLSLYLRSLYYRHQALRNSPDFFSPPWRRGWGGWKCQITRYIIWNTWSPIENHYEIMGLPLKRHYGNLCKNVNWMGKNSGDSIVSETSSLIFSVSKKNSPLNLTALFMLILLLRWMMGKKQNIWNRMGFGSFVLKIELCLRIWMGFWR